MGTMRNRDWNPGPDWQRISGGWRHADGRTPSDWIPPEGCRSPIPEWLIGELTVRGVPSGSLPEPKLLEELLHPPPDWRRDRGGWVNDNSGMWVSDWIPREGHGSVAPRPEGAAAAAPVREGRVRILSVTDGWVRFRVVDSLPEDLWEVNDEGGTC